MTDGWDAVFNEGLYICLYIGGLVKYVQYIINDDSTVPYKAFNITY